MGGVRGRGRAGSPGPELLLLLPPCCRGTMSGSDSTGTSMLFGATAWEKAPKEGKKAPTKKEGGLYKGKVGVGGGVGSASSGQRPRAAAGGGSEAHRPVCWAPAPWGQERPGQRHTQPEARQQRHPNHREHGGEHHCRTRGATRSSGRPGGQGRATTGAGWAGRSHHGGHAGWAGRSHHCGHAGGQHHCSRRAGQGRAGQGDARGTGWVHQPPKPAGVAKRRQTADEAELRPRPPGPPTLCPALCSTEQYSVLLVPQLWRSLTHVGVHQRRGHVLTQDRHLVTPRRCQQHQAWWVPGRRRRRPASPGRVGHWAVAAVAAAAAARWVVAGGGAVAGGRTAP